MALPSNGDFISRNFSQSRRKIRRGASSEALSEKGATKATEAIDEYNLTSASDDDVLKRLSIALGELESEDVTEDGLHGGERDALAIERSHSRSRTVPDAWLDTDREAGEKNVPSKIPEEQLQQPPVRARNPRQRSYCEGYRDKTEQVLT